MGRNAAGAGFLSGFARHAGVERFLGYARSREEFEHFRAHMNARSAQGAPGTQPCDWIPHGGAEGLAAAGALFVYAPGIGDFCWQRRAAGEAAWSVVGLTHTISSDIVMDAFGELLIAPAQPWDALICTSDAVKRTLLGVLEGYGAYLAERLGGKPPALRPELPVIPLGVDCGAFAQGEARAAPRAAARARMRLGADEVAFLFVGRLSYHAKAHPLPMYLALEAAAQQSDAPLVLILAGYFFNDSIERTFLDGAKRYCPSVRLIHVDGRKPEALAAAWAAADVFTSLSDNIQESFGLAPVEAMAAGLPAVVSDWDGYRDTVIHGETGFSVPTAMPGAGAGAEFASRYFAGIDTYDQYIGRVGQCTAVDVGAATEAYVALIGDPALRRRMGEAGRARARRVFDWSVIVPACLPGAVGRACRAARGAPAEGRPLRRPQPSAARRSVRRIPCFSDACDRRRDAHRARRGRAAARNRAHRREQHEQLRARIHARQRGAGAPAGGACARRARAGARARSALSRRAPRHAVAHAGLAGEGQHRAPHCGMTPAQPGIVPAARLSTSCTCRGRQTVARS